MMSKLKIEIKVVKGIKTINLLFPTDDQKFYQVLTELWKREGKKKKKEYFSVSIRVGGKNLKYISPRYLLKKGFYTNFRRKITVAWLNKKPREYTSFISLNFNDALKKKFLIILWRFIDLNVYDYVEEGKLMKRLDKLFPND